MRHLWETGAALWRFLKLTSKEIFHLLLFFPLREWLPISRRPLLRVRAGLVQHIDQTTWISSRRASSNTLRWPMNSLYPPGVGVPPLSQAALSAPFDSCTEVIQVSVSQSWHFLSQSPSWVSFRYHHGAGWSGFDLGVIVLMVIIGEVWKYGLEAPQRLFFILYMY